MTEDEFEKLNRAMFTESREGVANRLKEALGNSYRKGMLDSRKIAYTSVKIQDKHFEFGVDRGNMHVGGVCLLEEIEDIDAFCLNKANLAAIAMGLEVEEICVGLKEAITKMMEGNNG